MKCIIFCLFSVLSSQALAVTSEREELSNYLRELNKIDRIFIAAKSNSLKSSKNRFKYEVFEKDLARLKRELQVYLDLPNRNPRVAKKVINHVGLSEK